MYYNLLTIASQLYKIC